MNPDTKRQVDEDGDTTGVIQSAEDYDVVLNHPSRWRMIGHQIWKTKFRGDRRTINQEEAVNLIQSFELPKEIDGVLVTPKVLFLTGPGSYRKATIEEVRTNVRSTRSASHEDSKRVNVDIEAIDVVTEVKDYDVVLNHSRRWHKLGHQIWSRDFRGDRRPIGTEEAMEIAKFFATPRVIDGEFVTPRVLFKEKDGTYRKATIQEVITNVGSKRAPSAPRQQFQLQHAEVASSINEAANLELSTNQSSMGKNQHVVPTIPATTEDDGAVSNVGNERVSTNKMEQQSELYPAATVAMNIPSTQQKGVTQCVLDNPNMQAPSHPRVETDTKVDQGDTDETVEEGKDDICNESISDTITTTSNDSRKKRKMFTDVDIINKDNEMQESNKPLREIIIPYYASLRDLEGTTNKQYRSESQKFRKTLDVFMALPFSDEIPLTDKQDIVFYGHCYVEKVIELMWDTLCIKYFGGDASITDLDSFTSPGGSKGDKSYGGGSWNSYPSYPNGEGPSGGGTEGSRSQGTNDERNNDSMDYGHTSMLLTGPCYENCNTDSTGVLDDVSTTVGLDDESKTDSLDAAWRSIDAGSSLASFQEEMEGFDLASQGDSVVELADTEYPNGQLETIVEQKSMVEEMRIHGHDRHASEWQRQDAIGPALTNDPTNYIVDVRYAKSGEGNALDGDGGLHELNSSSVNRSSREHVAEGWDGPDQATPNQCHCQIPHGYVNAECRGDLASKFDDDLCNEEVAITTKTPKHQHSGSSNDESKPRQLVARVNYDKGDPPVTLQTEAIPKSAICSSKTVKFHLPSSSQESIKHNVGLSHGRPSQQRLKEEGKTKGAADKGEKREAMVLLVDSSRTIVVHDKSQKSASGQFCDHAASKRHLDSDANRRQTHFADVTPVRCSNGRKSKFSTKNDPKVTQKTRRREPGSSMGPMMLASLVQKINKPKRSNSRSGKPKGSRVSDLPPVSATVPSDVVRLDFSTGVYFIEQY